MRQTLKIHDLKELLEAWPKLVPDPLAIERTVQRMVSQMAALRTPPAEDLSEPQFRLLEAIWTAAAAAVYLAWPYISDFFTEYPSCRIALACLAGLSLLAPLVLLPLLRTERVETVPSQPKGGHTTC